MEAWMRRTVFSLAVLAWPILAFAQQFPSLEQTLQLARERGYRAEQVQWAQVAEEARSIASTNSEDAAIRFVLKSLKDGHSSYRPPTKADQARPNADPSVDRPAKVLSQPKDPIEGIPVIQVNGWSGSESEAMMAAAVLRSHVAEALVEPKCGVVLDFSSNTGGNMWPMLIGLSPLLTEGVLGYFQNAQGSARAIEKRSGKIFLNGSALSFNLATSLLPKNDAGRVAIIVGPRSSSSGEIVPILFHGQGNTRLFGHPTSGQSTANSTFTLPNGGLANITTAITLDRNRKQFDGRIEPEVLSEQPATDAARWISSGCQRR